MNYYFLSAILASYVLINFYVTKMINKANYLKEDRRGIHKRLIWIIPFIGPFIIKSYWRQSAIRNHDVMTKKKRKKSTGSFYESGIGQV